LDENLGVLGFCLVLWVKRAGVSGVGVLRGSGGVELYFYIGLLGLDGCACERAVFTGKVLRCRSFVDVFINVWEMLFEKKSEVGKILEGMGFEHATLGIRSAVTD
jgi:hypothetical protein